jgi:CheY-like chemotaxis protein
MEPKRRTDSPLVLVVEDDLDFREVLSELLRAEGFSVLAAANGLEAFERLRAGFLPSVIVTDLNMPKMDGWQFRKTQLADPALRDIPTVVMSGTATPGEASLSRLGAIEFLPKPIQVDTLMVLLQRLSRRRPLPVVATRG